MLIAKWGVCEGTSEKTNRYVRARRKSMIPIAIWSRERGTHNYKIIHIFEIKAYNINPLKKRRNSVIIWWKLFLFETQADYIPINTAISLLKESSYKIIALQNCTLNRHFIKFPIKFKGLHESNVGDSAKKETKSLLWLASLIANHHDG